MDLPLNKLSDPSKPSLPVSRSKETSIDDVSRLLILPTQTLLLEPPGAGAGAGAGSEHRLSDIRSALYTTLMQEIQSPLFLSLPIKKAKKLLPSRAHEHIGQDDPAISILGTEPQIAMPTLDDERSISGQTFDSLKYYKRRLSRVSG